MALVNRRNVVVMCRYLLQQKTQSRNTPEEKKWQRDKCRRKRDKVEVGVKEN